MTNTSSRHVLPENISKRELSNRRQNANSATNLKIMLTSTELSRKGNAHRSPARRRKSTAGVEIAASPDFGVAARRRRRREFGAGRDGLKMKRSRRCSFGALIYSPTEVFDFSCFFFKFYSSLIKLDIFQYFAIL